MRALLDVTQANKIEPKDVRTENFTLQPRYDGVYEARRIVGYEARKSLVVTLHDPDKVESLLGELFTFRTDGRSRLGLPVERLT